uniref:protein THEM6-like n=1 Tax=Myxine glutinosa TaxID=7769 RepID=UPI00358E079F
MDPATLALLALVVLLLNVDVLYFLRLFVVIFKGFVCKQQKDILKEHEIPGIVLFGDLDYMLHMNNARYLRECDFARYEF